MKLFIVRSRWDITLVRAENTTDALDLVGKSALSIDEVSVEGEAKIILTKGH